MLALANEAVACLREGVVADADLLLAAWERWDTDTPDRLVGAASPAAERVEIHAIKVVGPDLKMRQREGGLAIGVRNRERGSALLLLSRERPSAAMRSSPSTTTALSRAG